MSVRAAMCGLVALAVAGCVQTGGRPGTMRLAAGDRYVAMGSSFAAGPGVTTPADDVRRCARSADNYPHQLARLRGLSLVDVSCSGAATAHVLGPWSELAPQLEALTADTSLVTITVGGNDVGYIGGLIGASCQGDLAPSRPCSPLPPASEAAWRALDAAMTRIAAEVKRRAPVARLVFVEYPAVLPARGVCADTPMSAQQAEVSRAVAARLAALTRAVAVRAQAGLLPVATLSKGHDACAAVPWITGFPRAGGPKVMVPYHPNLAGMTAQAQALDRLLSR
jgi:lysophospholipase L1-like esterase